MWPEYIFLDRHISIQELIRVAASFFLVDVHDVIVVDDKDKVSVIDYQCVFLYTPTEGDFVAIVEIFIAIPLQYQYPDSTIFLKHFTHVLGCCILMSNSDKYSGDIYISGKCCIQMEV